MSETEKENIESQEFAESGSSVVIKPCPFCGNEQDCRLVSDAELEVYSGTGSNMAVVCCVSGDGCGALGGWRNEKEEAIDAWNTRAL